MDFGGATPPVPTVAELDYWQARGCTRIRLPIRWERLQPALFAALDSAWLQNLRTLVDGCISRGMKCLIDIHNFGAWNNNKIGTTAVPISAFADFWGRMSLAFSYADSSLVAYDIMNEPESMPNGETGWVDSAKAAIAAIRANDVTKVIYVEGYHYAGTWNWLADNPTLHTIRDFDPANKIVISGHCYPDRDNSGSHFSYQTESATAGTAPSGVNTNPNIYVTRIQPFIDWCATHGYVGHVGEMGCPADPLNPRETGDTGWQVAFENGLTLLQTNNIECDAWSAGPAWGQYPQSFYEYNGRQARSVTSLQKFWATTNVNPAGYFADGPSRGTAGVTSGNFTVDYRGHLAAPVTITPHSSAGGTWSPATRVLSGDNPVATFTLNIATQQTTLVTFTNSIGWTNPAAILFTTQIDDFTTIESSVQNVFSFQRKVATYLGPCIRLRRDSDNAESDFNFTANTMYADVDLAAIAAFKGAANLFVVRLYNQNSLVNPNHALPPYNGDVPPGTLADQPIFNLDDGDGWPSIFFDGTRRMDWESPLENVTGQVLITNIRGANYGYNLLNWSFIQFVDAWNPGWQITPSDGAVNIYGTTGDRIEMPGPSEVGEWHVHSGSWKAGLGGVGNVKVWRDNVLMGIGDSGATALCVDYHRNTCKIGYQTFGAALWYGWVRDIIICNGPVSDAVVNTIVGRVVTKYSTTDSHTPQAPDIVLDFAADTYTADGSASSLAANITASPTRDANGLICSGSQAYMAAGPLLNALQGNAFSIEVETFGLTEGATAVMCLLGFQGSASSATWGWEQTGGVNCVRMTIGGPSANYLTGADTTTIPSIPYSDDRGVGYMGSEHHHLWSQDHNEVNQCIDAELQSSITSTTMTPPLPNWTSVGIGWWPFAAFASGSRLTGRIMRIKVWRKKLTSWQRLRGSINLPPKGPVTVPMKMGVNLAGMEYGNGLPGGFENYPTANEANYYANKCGFKIVRVPFRWERMQPTLNGALAVSELAHLKTIVANMTAQGLTVLLDLHNYGAYFDVAANVWKDIGSGTLTVANGSDFWGRMAQQSEFNRADVWFGLMNEPVGGGTPDNWFTCCAAWAAAIRAFNTVSIITVPGPNSYTAAAQWSSDHGKSFLAHYSDSANKSLFEVHGYFDSDSSGTHGAAVPGSAWARYMNCVRWARNHGVRFVVGECGWTRDMNNNQAAVEANEIFDLLRNADDVCAAFCYWSGGPSAGAYFQNIEPYYNDDYGDPRAFADPRGDRHQMATMRKWIPNPY